MLSPMRNVRTVSYETHLSSYLSGICGAMMTKADHIGYVGGVSIPNLDAAVNALVAGARSVRPAMSVSVGWVGSFQDPTKALQVAGQMFAGDIDYIQAEAAASDLGTIQAANSHPGRIVSAGSRPQFALGPQTVAAIPVRADGGGARRELERRPLSERLARRRRRLSSL
jgi:basic membrane protein A